MTSTEQYLRERYGTASEKNRLLWLGGAIAALLIGGWLIWQAIASLQPQVHADFVGSKALSDSSTLVRYNVTSDVGQTVRCTVHAYNEAGIEVGNAEVETEITAQPTSVEVELPTTQYAERGDVTDCAIAR